MQASHSAPKRSNNIASKQMIGYHRGAESTQAKSRLEQKSPNKASKQMKWQSSNRHAERCEITSTQAKSRLEQESSNKASKQMKWQSSNRHAEEF